MQEFKFPSYCTEYSCEGSIKKAMRREACFSFVFNKAVDDSDVTYKVILYKGTDLIGKEHKNNACLFTKKEISNHLKQAQSIYPFEFKVKEVPNYAGTYPVYKVTLKVHGVPGTFHKYILTWLRYMYEYPYNVLLLDAYKLKKDPVFRFWSIANLFNLVLSCYCGDSPDIHQIAQNRVSKTMKVKELREKIKEVKRLNYIYEGLRHNRRLIKDKVGDLSIMDIEFWESNKLFEDERKPVYMDTYKDIKK